jgi:hypothetical protein
MEETIYRVRFLGFRINFEAEIFQFWGCMLEEIANRNKVNF